MKYIVLQSFGAGVIGITADDFCIHTYEHYEHGPERSEYGSLETVARDEEFIDPEVGVWDTPLGEGKMYVFEDEEAGEFPSCPDDENVIKVGPYEATLNGSIAEFVGHRRFLKVLRGVEKDARAEWDEMQLHAKGSLNEEHQRCLVRDLSRLIVVVEQLYRNLEEQHATTD